MGLVLALAVRSLVSQDFANMRSAFYFPRVSKLVSANLIPRLSVGARSSPEPKVFSPEEEAALQKTNFETRGFKGALFQTDLLIK